MFPSDLSAGTRAKLFDFVDAICAEFPELDSRLRAGVLRIVDGRLEFALRTPHIKQLDRWFWAMVTRNEQTNCWEWQGARNENGYGFIWLGGRRVLAHRASLYLITGVDRGSWGLHRCDNPPCVNPFHLYRGTRLDNLKDMLLRHPRYAKITALPQTGN